MKLNSGTCSVGGIAFIYQLRFSTQSIQQSFRICTLVELRMSSSESIENTGLAIFLDVIVPLYVPGTFTYRVPKVLERDIQAGRRVLVQFGKRKLQAAIIEAIHHDPPKNYEAKYILDVLDDGPIILSQQIAFWKWMSGYYMCHLGEVMSAALPGGYRLSSETLITPYDQDHSDMALSTEEHLVLEQLQIRERLNMDELQALVGSESKAYRLVKTMMAKRLIVMQEEVKARYRPIYETYIELNPEWRDEPVLNELFVQLESKAPKQVNLLLKLIEMSRFGRDVEVPVMKKTLLEKSEVSSAVLRSLVDKGVLLEVKSEVGRIKDASQIFNSSDLVLSTEQETALNEIRQGLHAKGRVLLHGVTSSGKTEVYISLIREYLAKGQQVLYLVPEIALTTQLIQRLQKHFGEEVVVYHSQHSQSERVEIWENLINPGIHDHRIVVGARSALFLPFHDLGLIIVDEEHDSSFKQYEPAPRYQARDACFILADLYKAQVVLGSATPGAESLQACKDGRMVKVDLSNRYGDVLMPEMQVVDIKREYKRKTMTSHFSSVLIAEMKESLDNGKQVILFQNRRGYNPLWQCLNCAWKPECNRCDVTLTYHRAIHKLKCHYCGSVHEPPMHCPACGSKDLKMVGYGTEKIEAEIGEVFPNAKVARMDLDTTRGKNALSKLFHDFEQRKVDILVGTQMVTKGLDFANVSLVGIMNADQLINHSDFRAYERAYQMMTQVAGRAGRDAKGGRGRVVIQTMDPEHWVIRNVVEHSYDRLMEKELKERQQFDYPPFTRLIRITLRHKNQNLIDHASQTLTDHLRLFLGSRILGPQYPFVARVKDQYRKELLIKIERKASITKTKAKIQQTLDQFGTEKEFKSIRVIVDVDPQ